MKQIVCQLLPNCRDLFFSSIYDLRHTTSKLIRFESGYAKSWRSQSDYVARIPGKYSAMAVQIYIKSLVNIKKQAHAVNSPIYRGE